MSFVSTLKIWEYGHHFASRLLPCQFGVPHCVWREAFAPGRIRASPKSLILARSSEDIWCHQQEKGVLSRDARARRKKIIISNPLLITYQNIHRLHVLLELTEIWLQWMPQYYKVALKPSISKMSNNLLCEWYLGDVCGGTSRPEQYRACTWSKMKEWRSLSDLAQEWAHGASEKSCWQTYHSTKCRSLRLSHEVVKVAVFTKF